LNLAVATSAIMAAKTIIIAKAIVITIAIAIITATAIITIAMVTITPIATSLHSLNGAFGLKVVSPLTKCS
jgi:hypothetical protein